MARPRAISIITCLLAGAIVVVAGEQRSAAAELPSLALSAAELARLASMQQAYPQRREHPLRAVNLSDAEVTAIVAAADATIPGAVVNIGSVVEGCPCQDGAGCTEQVWIVANTPHTAQGLLLSRIAGQWQIGPAQSWWLRYRAFQGRWPRAPRRAPETYLAERAAILGAVPACRVPGA